MFPEYLFLFLNLGKYLLSNVFVVQYGNRSDFSLRLLSFFSPQLNSFLLSIKDLRGKLK